MKQQKFINYPSVEEMKVRAGKFNLTELGKRAFSENPILAVKRDSKHKSFYIKEAFIASISNGVKASRDYQKLWFVIFRILKAFGPLKRKKILTKFILKNLTPPPLTYPA